MSNSLKQSKNSFPLLKKVCSQIDWYRYASAFLKLILVGVIGFSLTWIGGNSIFGKVEEPSLNLLSVAAGVFIGAVGIIMSYMAGMIGRMRTVLIEAGLELNTVVGLIEGIDKSVHDIKHNAWMLLGVIVAIFFLDLLGAQVQVTLVSSGLREHSALFARTWLSLSLVLMAFVSVWDSVNAIFGFYDYSSEIEKIASDNGSKSK